MSPIALHPNQRDIGKSCHDCHPDLDTHRNTCHPEPIRPRRAEDLNRSASSQCRGRFLAEECAFSLLNLARQLLSRKPVLACTRSSAAPAAADISGSLDPTAKARIAETLNPLRTKPLAHEHNWRTARVPQQISFLEIRSCQTAVNSGRVVAERAPHLEQQTLAGSAFQIANPEWEYSPQYFPP